MPNKKINQLDAKTAVSTDLMLVGDPINGTAYKSTFANLPLVPNSRTLTINGVAFDLSANRIWTIDALPSQTGNSGKYLTTNGTAASWGTIDLSGFVPTSRTLTINGTAFDLSANRSWTIAAGITGSGIANQLTYWNGTGSVTGSTGLVYNDSTGTFGINKSQNNPTAINITNATSGTSGRAGISFISNTASGQFIVQKYSTLHTAYKINLATDAILYNDTAGDISILNDFATGKIKFASGGSSTAQMTLTAAGRLLLGTTTESTFILDAVGSARISQNQNAQTLLSIANTTSGTASNAALSLTSDSSSGVSALQKNSTTYTTYKILNAKDAVVYNNNIGGDIAILNDFATGKIKFATGGVSNSQMTINETGIVDIPFQFVVGTSGNTIPSAVLKARFVNNTSGSDVEINGNGYGRLYFNDYSQGANLKYYEMLNFGTDFKISRLNDLNTLRTERLTIFGATGNVFVGTSPSDSASALLNVSSTTKGFLPPRMTTTQINAIATPAEGLQVYNTTINHMCIYQAGAWAKLSHSPM